LIDRGVRGISAVELSHDDLTVNCDGAVNRPRGSGDLDDVTGDAGMHLDEAFNDLLVGG
jgi:hypothetical protein